MSNIYYHDPRQAKEFLLAHGAIRYDKDGLISHLSCSLTPWQADAAFIEESMETTSLWTKVYHAVASDDEFLYRELAQARAADPFIENLFLALGAEAAGKPALYLNRNDCMPALGEDGQAIWPKQVEMNLMASALGEASSVVWRMHRFVGQEQDWRLLDNRAGENLAAAIAYAYQKLAVDGIVLMLVPIGEVSVFDQRITETRLVEEHGLSTRRTSLEELGRRGELRGGDLYFDGVRVAIAYFRSGYAPFHYTNAYAWEARRLIEASSAISVPSARTQLANTKLVQQVLSTEEALREYVGPAEAKRLAKTCVRFSKLDDVIVTAEGSQVTGAELARANYSDWVLKPHREGGGNNFFGEQMLKRLDELEDKDKAAYILMEKIRQQPFESVRLIDGELKFCRCVTELGFFSTAYFEPGTLEPDLLRTEGYLLRTKDEGVDEGLVLGGFSFLDTVLL